MIVSFVGQLLVLFLELVEMSSPRCRDAFRVAFSFPSYSLILTASLESRELLHQLVTPQSDLILHRAASFSARLTVGLSFLLDLILALGDAELDDR